MTEGRSGGVPNNRAAGVDSIGLITELVQDANTPRRPGQPPTPPAQQQQQPPAAQTLTGTIVKDGSRFILKVSSSSAYQLDDQDKAKQYEGKQVKINGTLDASGNSFHIISIELIS